MDLREDKRAKWARNVQKHWKTRMEQEESGTSRKAWDETMSTRTALCTSWTTLLPTVCSGSWRNWWQASVIVVYYRMWYNIKYNQTMVLQRPVRMCSDAHGWGLSCFSSTDGWTHTQILAESELQRRYGWEETLPPQEILMQENTASDIESISWEATSKETQYCFLGIKEQASWGKFLFETRNRLL